MKTIEAESRVYIYGCLGAMIDEQKFVITKSFRELVKNFNDGFKILTINGPKGVGKTLALAAIYALNKGKSPCLIISPLTLMSTTFFYDYVKEVYARHEKGKCFMGGIVPDSFFWCHKTVAIIPH